MTPQEETADTQSSVSDFVELAIPRLEVKARSDSTKTIPAALAPSTIIHGVMVEVFGIGVLITGDSGVGKSECALELISKGHRLISDDAVEIKRVGDELTAKAPERIRDLLEIRGLGIVNAKELFGVSAIAPDGAVELCVDFTGREDAGAPDPLGVEEYSIDLLGISVRRFPIPITPGRNLATLVEAAVRVFVSGRSGPAAAEASMLRHSNSLTSKSSN